MDDVKIKQNNKDNLIEIKFKKKEESKEIHNEHEYKRSNVPKLPMIYYANEAVAKKISSFPL